MFVVGLTFPKGRRSGSQEHPLPRWRESRILGSDGGGLARVGVLGSPKSCPKHSTRRRHIQVPNMLTKRHRSGRESQRHRNGR